MKKDFGLNNIDHPKHYNMGNIETIDIIESLVENLTGFEGYIIGNILKYLHRYKYKNGKEDLEKARWYMDKLISLFTVTE